MHTAYLLITILFAAMVAFSAVAKVRRDPKVVHELDGVIYDLFDVHLAVTLL